jgi:hypothetical protein
LLIGQDHRRSRRRHPRHGLAGGAKEKTDLPARLKSLPGGNGGSNGAQICQCGQWPRSPIWEDNGAVPDPDKIVKMQIARKK